MTATIQCKPNGPYLVKGLEELTDSQGARILHEAIFALCRCGGSAKKPFCDATHKTNGFSDACVSAGSDDKLESYSGPGITIHDNRSICAHAGHCTDGLAAVFKYGSEPWIDPSGGEVRAIVETIRNCPSGALGYSVDGQEQVVATGTPKITVTKDGPYAVQGDVELIEARWAQGASKVRYTLCRCGASKNKPFCDGSHAEARFVDGK